MGTTTAEFAQGRAQPRSVLTGIGLGTLLLLGAGLAVLGARERSPVLTVTAAWLTFLAAPFLLLGGTGVVLVLASGLVLVPLGAQRYLLPGPIWSARILGGLAGLLALLALAFTAQDLSTARPAPLAFTAVLLAGLGLTSWAGLTVTRSLADPDEGPDEELEDDPDGAGTEESEPDTGVLEEEESGTRPGGAGRSQVPDDQGHESQ